MLGWRPQCHIDLPAHWKTLAEQPPGGTRRYSRHQALSRRARSSWSVWTRTGWCCRCQSIAITFRSLSATTLCHFGPFLLQVMGVVHGGAITTLADTAAGFGCMLSTNGKGITTIELKTNFVGSAKEGDLLIARAWCQHAGKTTQVPRPSSVLLMLQQ